MYMQRQPKEDWDKFSVDPNMSGSSWVCLLRRREASACPEQVNNVKQPLEGCTSPVPANGSQRDARNCTPPPPAPRQGFDKGLAASMHVCSNRVRRTMAPLGLAFRASNPKTCTRPQTHEAPLALPGESCAYKRGFAA